MKKKKIDTRDNHKYQYNKYHGEYRKIQAV